MKYTSNRFSVNITRVLYLRGKNNSDGNYSDILSYVNEKKIYDNDIVIDVTPYKKNYSKCLSVLGSGAGTTIVGSKKEDTLRMYSFAKFKHTRKRKHKYNTDEDWFVHDMLRDSLSDEVLTEFGEVSNKINMYLSNADQSLYHMMAKYAAYGYNAASKGMCGITRNCRNIYTIDCDAWANFNIVRDVFLNKTSSLLENYDPDLINGLIKMRDLIYKIYDLTGSLPHIVYNDKTSHFQIQYLMKDPIYLYEDAFEANGKKEADNKKEWISLYNRCLTEKITNDPNNIYDILDRYCITSNCDNIIIIYRDLAGRIKNINVHPYNEFISKQYEDNSSGCLADILNDIYTPQIDLGIRIFERAKGDPNLLKALPEYELYGKAHKNMSYLNNNKYIFADSNYTYCANKSLAIGTDYDRVFYTESENNGLYRYQIIRSGDSFEFDQFDLLKLSSWKYADQYSIDSKFIAFIGSLNSAEELFKDIDIVSKYEEFKTQNKFYHDGVVLIDHNTVNLYDQPYIYDEHETDIEYLEHQRDKISETNDRCKKILSNIDIDIFKNIRINTLCEKYTDIPYDKYIRDWVGRIEEMAVNNNKIGRYQFDHRLGMSVLYKSLYHNESFRDACKSYINGDIKNRDVIDDVNDLISYMFNDIIHNIYNDNLPGTVKSGEYHHNFNIYNIVASIDISKFESSRIRKQGYVDGPMALVLYAGTAKLDIIPTLLDDILPTYIHREYLLNDNAKNMCKRKVITMAWKQLLDDAYDPMSPLSEDLYKISKTYNIVQAKGTNSINYLIKHALKDSGVGFFLKRNKHMAEYCIETCRDRAFDKNDKHGWMNKYICSLEYFNQLVLTLLNNPSFNTIDIFPEVLPNIEEPIQNSVLNTKYDKHNYVIKNRDIVISKLKTYRYFMFIYDRVNATVKTVDIPGEESHIKRLRDITHELLSNLKQFLDTLKKILHNSYGSDNDTNMSFLNQSSYTITKEDVRKVINDIMLRIEIHYNMIELFRDVDNDVGVDDA